MLVIIFIVFIYVFINFIVGWHGAILLSHSSLSISIEWYWTIFWIIALSYLIARVPVIHKNPMGRLLKVIGSYYFGVMEYAFILIVFADLITFLLYLLGIETAITIPYIGVITLVLLAVLMIKGSWNAWHPVLRTYNLHMDKQAGEYKQLRIGMASDLHLGNVVGNRHLNKLIKQMNELKPDLILLPGDVIDDSIEPFIRNRMLDKLKLLKAKLGVYAVLGNHEYYGGHLKEYVRMMMEIGIPVLRDESVLLDQSIQLIGRKDKTAERSAGGRQPVISLTSKLDHHLPMIMMDHQPYQYELAATAGIDLLLSGHTHKGQMAPNHWITRKLFELDWGYKLKGKMHAIVSSGFGTWGPPIRIGSRSEIVEIVITFKGASS